MATQQFVIAVDARHVKALNKVVEAKAEAERKWLHKAREDAGLAFLRGAKASEARRRIRVEFARLREQGKLTGTRDLVLAGTLREELAAREMNREWPSPPAGEVDAPGRRWGVSPSTPEGEGGYDGRMAVRLPADLAEQMRRAAYWTSAQAVTALQAWDAAWGDGPDVMLRRVARQTGGKIPALAVFAAATAPRPSADALLERSRLRKQIVTTGDLLRAAVLRALA